MVLSSSFSVTGGFQHRVEKLYNSECPRVDVNRRVESARVADQVFVLGRGWGFFVTWYSYQVSGHKENPVFLPDSL